MGTSPWIVSDELWDHLEPLLPQRVRRFRYPGRRPLPDRGVLCGILCMLHTGIQWEYLPQDLGSSSGMTCWRRLRDWNEADVWQRLHEVLPAELNAAARLDGSRCVVDSSHVRAQKGEPDGPVATARDWVPTDGSWRGLSHGCMASDACAPERRAAGRGGDADLSGPASKAVYETATSCCSSHLSCRRCRRRRSCSAAMGKGC